MTDNSTNLSDTAADAATDIDTEDATPLAARAEVTDSAPAFADFEVKPEIVKALADVGITHTFAIQAMTLPIALAGNDLIGQARTGTGKTLGFGVPLLNRLNLPGGEAAAPQALVVAPTRELAVQVSGDIKSAGKYLGARALTIYGGRAYEPQIEALRNGVDVVVGTPGRLLDLAQQGHLVLGAVRMLVLDEADEMLDLGFLPDIEKLLKLVPDKRQTMLFSATMPGPIVTLARTFLHQPIQIRAEHGSTAPAIEHIDQYVYRAHSLDKPELIARILQARDRGLTMIFVRTKRTAARVAEELESRGFAVGSVHGDLGQGAREQALRAFRSGKVGVLVATDVAARGLDVEGITHVINYQAPEDEMTYIHRIGRTARAGASGTAVTLVDWDDIPRWALINTKLQLPFAEPPETYSTSEHLYDDLDIPREARGVLPRAERTRAGLAAEHLEDLGGRPRGRSGERGGARPARSTSRGERSDKPRGERSPHARDRQRTRTRGGRPVEGAAETGGAVAEGQPRPPAAKRRRRRRPGGSAPAAAAAAE